MHELYITGDAEMRGGGNLILRDSTHVPDEKENIKQKINEILDLIKKV
jgi:hypothetical protein